MVPYVLQKVTHPEKEQICSDTIKVTKDITFIIKQEYFLSETISFENFLINMLDIQGTEITQINSALLEEWDDFNELQLNTQIECNQDDANINYCALIQQQSKSDNYVFYDQVTAKLQLYFENDDLLFVADNGATLDIICKNCKKQTPDYFLYVLSTVVGLLFIFSVFAFLFNKRKFPKLPGFNVVDDARWTALMIYALQFWDFYRYHIHATFSVHCAFNFILNIQ